MPRKRANSLRAGRFRGVVAWEAVELHASLQSLFARHLTNYLAAWGMDVSHFPIEDEEEEMLADSSNAEAKVSTARQDSGYGGSIGGRTPKKKGQSHLGALISASISKAYRLTASSLSTMMSTC